MSLLLQGDSRLQVKNPRIHAAPRNDDESSLFINLAAQGPECFAGRVGESLSISMEMSTESTRCAAMSLQFEL